MHFGIFSKEIRSADAAHGRVSVSGKDGKRTSKIFKSFWLYRGNSQCGDPCNQSITKTSDNYYPLVGSWVLYHRESREEVSK